METQEEPNIKYYQDVPVVMRPKKGHRKARERAPPPDTLPPPPTPPPSPPDADPRFPRDRHFNSRNVVALTEYNFDEFIGPKQKALIMFYDINKSENRGLEFQFSEASDKSLDFHHAYGAVDCFYDARLCERENVDTTPILKLFSNGFEVSTIKFPHDFNSTQMHMLMKMTPILTKSKMDMGKDILMAAATQPEDCTPRKTSCYSCFQ